MPVCLITPSYGSGILRAIFFVFATFCMTACGQAQVDFSFNYTDVNTGFNDSTLGAQRRAALENSASIVESLFKNYTATINIDVNGGVTNNSFLASAGSNYNSAFPGTGFGSRGDVMTKILGGVDPNTGAADGTVARQVGRTMKIKTNKVVPVLPTASVLPVVAGVSDLDE